MVGSEQKWKVVYRKKHMFGRKQIQAEEMQRK